MANTFTRKLSQNIGTSATAIGAYTVAANTTVVVVGLTVTNKTGSSITANVFISDGSANTYVSANAPISSGSSLVAVGGDQKVVLLTGDKVYVESSAASSIDAVLSILEIT
jgi:hypothetical protein